MVNCLNLAVKMCCEYEFLNEVDCIALPAAIQVFAEKTDMTEDAMLDRLMTNRYLREYMAETVYGQRENVQKILDEKDV